MVRLPGTTCLISHILVNPAKSSLAIISGTPIDIQGVHSRKAKDNSTTSSPKKLTCYYCKGEHMVKDCIKLAKEKSWDKQKDTDMAKHYKNKI